MTDSALEQRVAALEESARQGREADQRVASTLEALAAQVSKLEVYLSNGNGGFSLTVRHKRVRFAGSISLPWLMGFLGGGSGGGWALGRLFGAW